MTVELVTIILTAILGLIAFSVQSERTRQHDILKQRREIYLDYADALSLHLFKQININSEHHFARRDAINRVGARLVIIATDEINAAHRELIEYLRKREMEADDNGLINQYFDDRASMLFDHVLELMRIDAVPKTIRNSREGRRRRE